MFAFRNQYIVFIISILCILNKIEANIREPVSVSEDKSTNNVQITPTILEYDKHLQRSSILYGLIKVANSSIVGETCLKELKWISQSILQKEPWAIKVLDASAAKPSGFVFQHNYWLGSREACTAAMTPLEITLFRDSKRRMHSRLLSDVAPFAVDYRVVYMKHNSPWQLDVELLSNLYLQVGLCMPVSCTVPEIKLLSQVLMQNGDNFDSIFYELNTEVLYVKDLKLRDEFYDRISYKLILILLIFTSSMILFANCFRKEITISQESQKNKDTQSYIGVLKNVLKCFDIRDNAQKLFATRETRSNDIPIVNGLRSVAAFLIVILHIFMFSMHTTDNKPTLIRIFESKEMFLNNLIPYLLDVFFTISGFIQTYKFLQSDQFIATIRGSTFLHNVGIYVKLLLHRYMRLAPMLIVMILIVDLLAIYITDCSVYHIYVEMAQSCADNWWHSVFLLQSLTPILVMCVNWSWTLSCEMQYFIVAMLLLFAYVRHPKIVNGLVLIILTSNIALTYQKSIKNHYNFTFESQYTVIDDLHTNPFVRIFPYIQGSIMGWYFSRESVKITALSASKQKLLWYFSSLLVLGTMFTMVYRDLDAVTTITLHLLGRFMISLATGWMIVGSATGSSCAWSRLLEAKPFQHINRLTFTMYLLNPALIIIMTSLTESPMHADPYIMSILCVYFCVMTYLASIVFSLIFEMPYSNLVNLMMRSNQTKKE